MKWRKLYSTPSLLLLAALTLGIWSWNFSSRNPSPTPEPRKSAEEILGITPSPSPSSGRRIRPTAMCRDGTYSYSANRRGTCSHHGGVAEWNPNP
jgi:uncharacterized protein DUF3761